jgi:radial spoke head protein 4A
MASDKAKEAIAFLQKTSDATGGTVYDHLASVVGKILEERPAGAVDLLETTLLVKKTAFDSNATGTILPTNQNPKDTARSVATTKLYTIPQAPINPDTGEPEDVEPPNEFETENVLSDAAMFGAVGVGFTQTEWYNIMLSIKQLGEDPVKGVKTLRFFGKFFGVKSDYYVFEATLNEDPEPEEGEADPNIMPPEDAGTGANAYVYFVCAQPGGPVSKLPNVTPEQIKVARQIKKYLTGDLKAEVSAYPPFPGLEANFLRAQIARIASTTVICPSGFFTVGEDEVSLEKEEEFTPQESVEMMQPENWCPRALH